MRTLTVIALLLCASVAAQAQETALFYNSAPGDYIGGGQQKYYTSQQLNFVVTRGSSNVVDFSITNFNLSPSVWWYLQFAAANNAVIVPGTYTGALRYPFNNSQNGLSFSGEGRGCNTLTGTFTVLEAQYSGSTVTRFAADFEQHCEGGAAALFGGVRYNSTITNPVPQLTGVNPSSIPGGASATVAVAGANFLASTVVRWNGNDRSATFVNSGQLTATIPASDLTTPGSAQITVYNPGQGGGVSNAIGVTVVNPVPTVSSLSPTSTPAAGAAFTLTVNGTRFVSGSEVSWNGSPRSTTVVSSTQLRAQILASDIPAVGTAQVTVSNPQPGGGVSSALNFTISNPVPIITSLAPPGMTVGSPALALTVTGSYFLSGSTVFWKGASRPTTFVSSTQLVALISTADLSIAGNAQVTVSSPPPGGGVSTAALFAVMNPVPVITGLSPSSVTAGGPAFVLTVTGSNFVSGSVIRWNGNNRATLVTSTQLTAAIPASDIATAGSAEITVVSPSPGGGGSNALGFSITGSGVTSYPYSYYFPHLAFGGGWQSVLTLINYSPQNVSCETVFMGRGGAPMSVPFGGNASATRNDTLPAGGSVHQESTGDAAGPIITGWAQTRCSGQIKANVSFRSYEQGRVTAEAGLNAATIPATRFVTYAGGQTGFAYANPSTQTASISVTALDSSGARIGTASVSLPAGMQGASMLADLFGSQNFSGSIQIVSSVPIITLSLNFEAAPVFSSLPPGELEGSTPLSAAP